MKKLLPFLPVLLTGAVVATFFVLTNRGSRPAVPVVAPAVPIVGDNRATTTPKVSPRLGGAGVYKGQALDYLGEPSVLAHEPAAFVAANKQLLEGTIVIISKNPKEALNWIQLGLIKKTLGNYAGARDAWEYAKFVDPKQPIVYYDLGDLYSAYLKNNLLAEKNYMESVALDPYNYYPYLGLAQFYGAFHKEKASLVPAVLLSGLRAIPNDPSLILALATYYRDAGNATKAADYFDQYLQVSPDIDAAHKQLIKEEIAKLRYR